jgi:ubiquinone/menaquinone biosynthesis C-methylase UbiE
MFSNPEENIAYADIREGMCVADLGAGTGAYSIPAAKRVGYTGKVYAVEVQKDLLARIKEDARRAHLSNIEAVWGDIERVGGTKLASHIIDVVILANVLFIVKDKDAIIQEVFRILKPGGTVLIIDWKDSYGGMGPSPQMLISKIHAEQLFNKYGFTLVRDVSAGPHHYGILLKKP